MNRAFDLRMGESHIEVYKFRTGAIPIATLLALVIQAWLPLHFMRAALLDLPLLVVIYLGLSRRNPSTGLLLGTAVGLMQDSLSGPTVPLGLFGIAKPSSATWLPPSARDWTPNIPRRDLPSPQGFSLFI